MVGQEELRGKIMAALTSNQCSVIREELRVWDSDTNNSDVIALPSLYLNKVLPSEHKEIAMNIINIKGETKERLHYHTAHVIGLALSGEGEILSSDSSDTSKITKTSITKGDILIIPKGVYHILNARGSELQTVVIELSGEPIDFKSHY